MGGARAGAATNSYDIISTNLGKSKCVPSYQSRVANEFTGQPEERLLKVVVGLRRDIVVLQVLLPVESDGLRLDFSLLNINLVSGQDDGDVLANADQVTWMKELSIFEQTTLLMSETYDASWERSCR